jgi:hypothetical protein
MNWTTPRAQQIAAVLTKYPNTAVGNRRAAQALGISVASLRTYRSRYHLDQPGHPKVTPTPPEPVSWQHPVMRSLTEAAVFYRELADKLETARDTLVQDLT